jgi:hypothetical protein
MIASLQRSCKVLYDFVVKTAITKMVIAVVECWLLIIRAASSLHSVLCHYNQVAALYYFGTKIASFSMCTALINSSFFKT